MRKKPLLPLFLALLLLQSCANYKLNYSKDGKNWENLQPDPGLKIEHTIYLIGDAGGAETGETPAALRLLEAKLQDAPKNATAVFLGDNIYPNGLAPKKAFEERAKDEYRLKAQLDAVKDFKGDVYFIAGNHDWYGYGLDGLKRQQKFIEDYLGRKNVFLPKPGCGDPKEIKLNDKLVLILIDSQWFLQDWDGEYEINDGCEIKSRDVFKRYIEETIKSNRDKNVVIALHHPPYTYGPHGGQFTVKQHIFPLTDLSDGLWLPLPVLGSAFQFLRANVGHNQDVAHPRYKELTQSIVASARRNGNFIFASGHEHSLQYIEKDDQYFIVSGGGSKRSPSKTGDGSLFAYGDYGFAQLDFYEDGSAWVHYWSPSEDGAGERLVFRKQVKGPLRDVIIEVKDDYPDQGVFVERPLSIDRFGKGGIWDFFWGKHYRKAYDTPVVAPSLNLEEYKGGVIPVQRGGGYQTNSLRLTDNRKRDYAMRSIDKDATRTLAYPFNQSFAAEILKDNFSASHPLSALPVPALARAINVYSANPELYYVPKQRALGIYNEDYGDALYIVEERPDDDVWQDAPEFGNPKDILSTSEVITDVLEKHDHLIDYSWVVRSRLFDVLLGDWDRHEDQWRWSKIEQEDYKLYRPIPRDRDQAFCKYDGIVLAIGRQTAPNVKKLGVYKGKIKGMRWLIYNARHFDRTFLAGADWKDWEREARFIQKYLTDEVIDSAFLNAWPENIYRYDGARITANLKSRRDRLLDAARDFYLIRSRVVDVIGTNKKDLFEVERLDDRRTRVRLYDTNKHGEKEDLLLDRTFLSDETREIHLYGLDDNDFFIFRGEARNAIKIRAIGGLGEDKFIDESPGSGGKKTLIYDALDEKTEISEGKNTVDKRTNRPEFNMFNRRSYDYEFDFTTLLPIIAFNPDDGLLLGINGTYTTYGFRKSPHSTFHQLQGLYALETSGIAVGYTGEFIDVLGKWEVRIEAAGQTPLYAANFYGLGNDTRSVVDENVEDLNFHRVRQSLFSFMPAVSRKINHTSYFSFGPTFESIRIDRTQGRFIDQIGDELNQEIFEGLHFLGARMVFHYVNVDNPAIPTRGVGLDVEAGWKQQLNNLDKDFPYLNASFSAYQKIDSKGSLVLATRLGIQHRFTDDFEFYQGADLGGPGPNPNFRGFRRNRFTGKTAFFQNIDLRWRIVNSDNPTLPFSMGLLGGFDHGRVWVENEDSDTWHFSYGGGIWLAPFDIVTLNFSLFLGDGKQNRFNFGGSFFF